jgi:hypothetical protein
MAALIQEDTELRRILQDAKVIAVVGFSGNPQRTSHQIGQLLRRKGYTVYPVNPTVEGIDGMKSYASLEDVPEPIDIVNVFRRPEHLEGVVEDAIDAGAKVVWAQLGIADDAAAAKAVGAGLDMVMDRCIKVEHARLLGG